MQPVNVVQHFGRTGPAAEIAAEHFMGPLRGWSAHPQADQQTGDDGRIHLERHTVGTLTQQVPAVQDTFEPPKEHLDVIVATHKTIDLVVQTQVYKLKRRMRTGSRS
jgi:hypothetical protein